MATAPPEFEDIRRRMAQIRRDLHEDVKGVVEGAEAATDWRRFVRNYPWAMTGAAVVLGYLIVPRKHHPTTTVQIAPAQIAQAVAAEPAQPIEIKKSKSLLGSAFGLVAPLVFRTAQGYALQFAEQWLAQKVAEQMGQHPDLAAAFGATSPPPTEPQGPRVARRAPQGSDHSRQTTAEQEDMMVDRSASLESGLSDAREKALEFAATAREQISGGTHLLREYIIKEPARALGIAVGMGVILGWLIKRR